MKKTPICSPSFHWIINVAIHCLLNKHDVASCLIMNKTIITYTLPIIDGQWSSIMSPVPYTSQPKMQPKVPEERNFTFSRPQLRSCSWCPRLQLGIEAIKGRTCLAPVWLLDECCYRLFANHNHHIHETHRSYQRPWAPLLLRSMPKHSTWWMWRDVCLLCLPLKAVCRTAFLYAGLIGIVRIINYYYAFLGNRALMIIPPTPAMTDDCNKMLALFSIAWSLSTVFPKNIAFIWGYPRLLLRLKEQKLRAGNHHSF